jgi:hypothetical protein
LHLGGAGRVATTTTENKPMHRTIAWSATATLAAALLAPALPASAADAGAATSPVAGEKLDSGLGDLPHYSKWADPTGRTPMQARAGADAKAADAKPAADAARRDDQRAPSRGVQVSSAK